MDHTKRRGRPPLKARDDMTPEDNDLVGTVAKAPTPRTLRGSLRDDDPVARARARAAALREHAGEVHEGTDEFYINPEIIPQGWTYEWKRRTILNAEDPAYAVALARAGWEPVPASRHPSFMPSGGNYTTIERKGMVLMERPTEINDEARYREQRNARAQVSQKEDQLNSAKDGQFDRSNKGSSMVKIGKSYSPIQIPD